MDNYPLASPVRRFLALFFETLLAGSVGALGVFSPILMLTGYTIFITLQAILYTKSTSIGKLLFHLVVVTQDRREPVSFGIMLFRETLGKFLSSIPFSLGFWWALFNPKRQSWHDLLVGSVVVYNEEM